MVQFIPAKDDWANAFRQIGGGVAKGYMNRTDENAVKKAISDLGPNATARDILNALTNVKTYGNEAKQQALSNYLGQEQFEEIKRKAKESESLERARIDIENAKLNKSKTEADLERQNVKTIVDQL
ncbi:MAG: hypothetical protein KGL39_56940, partial [Patescibacteria group bacterium]|nr:hypothetical protein [Patescibacteria group bacterium]